MSTVFGEPIQRSLFRCGEHCVCSPTMLQPEANVGLDWANSVFSGVPTIELSITDIWGFPSLSCDGGCNKEA